MPIWIKPFFVPQYCLLDIVLPGDVLLDLGLVTIFKLLQSFHNLCDNTDVFRAWEPLPVLVAILNMIFQVFEVNSVLLFCLFVCFGVLGVQPKLHHWAMSHPLCLLFLMHLLAYNSSTGGYIVTFTYVLTKYLSLIYPLHHSPCSTSPFLRTVSTGFILLFSYMDTKHIHHIHPHSPFPWAHSLPLIPTPRKDLLFPPILHF
jgi:hypothetical protein